MGKIKVGIIGATGYTGMELLRILIRHPGVALTLLTSEKQSGKKVEEVFPYLKGSVDLTLRELSDQDVARNCTFAFSCLPHSSAMNHIPKWLQKGTKVIDLSADFRLRSAKVYEEWYERHAAPDLLKEAVYGLPELHRQEIRGKALVANPGCYPTGAILGLAPLIRAKIIRTDGIVIDSKSGVTGAGRGPVIESLFSEVNESVHAYKIGRHRHTPEIEQEISLLAGHELRVSFTPHLIPMDRGILSTLYASALRKMDTKEVLKVFRDSYEGEPFVRILPEGVLPKTKEVRGTNLCEIGAVFDPRTDRIVVVTAIDNLMRGASSQAVHNMNLMSGLEETTGIANLPLIP